MTSRSLEEQFEPEVAARLRLVSEAFLALRVSGRVSNYYLLEIARAIDHGMLLAAIELATTLLEIWLRDLLVIRKATQVPATSSHELRWRMTKHDREIEGTKRGAGFAAMVEELRQFEVLDDEETAWLKETYEKIRTPFHHGISGRIVDPTLEHGDLLNDPDTKEAMFLATILASAPDRRINQFEEFVDHQVGTHLEGIVNFLAAHQIPRVKW
jgi:hypothetical protein